MSITTETTFSGHRAADLAGITYRQLDYWARTDLVRPTAQDARGSGSRRRYSYGDVLKLKTIKRLLDAGISFETVRDLFEVLAGVLDRDETDAKVVIDGGRILLIRGNGELIDLVNEGRRVLSILPVAGVKKDLDDRLLEDLFREAAR